METQPYLNTRKRKKKLLNDENDGKGEDSFQKANNSQDLFSDYETVSQKTTPSQRAEQGQLKKQITDFTWVQCDNVDCQKWRRLHVNESDGLSQRQWYCYMGSDPKYSSCEAPEEDHHAYDKLARKLGLSYVMSQLTQGTLVWARMTGYCRWPALITMDPACGMSCEWDIEGEPQVYHVEYLGTKHSHGWIKANKLTLYGHKEEENSQKVFKPRKCRTKQMALTMAANKKLQRRKYNSVPVDVAIIEADQLLHLKEDQRLALCTFKYQKMEEKLTESPDRTRGGRGRSKKNYQKSCCQLCGTEDTLSQKKSIKQGKMDRKHDSSSHKDEAVVPSSQPCTTDNDNLSQSDKFEFENLKFKSTLVDKSKEEKFKIDVEMYKKNEKAFDHDLRRFMARNKVTVRKTPVWQCVPIGLFQIFLSVFERGGYKKVCASRSWTAVYKELTEFPVCQSSVGGLAKNYYERNVYPYELYITGGDYEAALDNLRNKRNKKPGNVDVGASAVPDVPESDKLSDQAVTVDDNKNIEQEEEEEEDVDLEAMLIQLEAYDKMCQLEDDVDAAQKRLGIDITYHDDSSGSLFSPGIKLADTASEFGLSYLPDDGAQMVPSHPTSVGTGDSADNPSHSDQILQELLVLDDEFQQLEHEMASFL